MKKTGPRSIPLAEAQLIALAEVHPEDVTDAIALKIREGFKTLVSDKQFLKSISSGTNGKGAIQQRVHMATEMVKAAFQE